MPAAALLAFWGLVLLGTSSFPASALDEGTLLAYPSRMLSGDVPHRDFQTLYGPANLWILAGAFKVFGASLGVERAVGLAFRLLALGSALWIGARFGRVAAVAGAALAAVVWLPLYAQANAALTALALVLLALALLAHAAGAAAGRAGRVPRSSQTASRQHPCTSPAPGRHAPALAAALAGAAAGLAVLVRFDFLPAVALALVPLLLAAGRPSWRPFALGVLPMLVLGAVHLAIVGATGVERVLRDIVDGASARDLPLPGLDTTTAACLRSACWQRCSRRRSACGSCAAAATRAARCLPGSACSSPACCRTCPVAPTSSTSRRGRRRVPGARVPRRPCGRAVRTRRRRRRGRRARRVSAWRGR